jgi:uncharacterized protein
MNDSFSQKLKALGVQLGAKSVIRRKREDSSIFDVLELNEEQTIYGKAYFYKKDYSFQDPLLQFFSPQIVNKKRSAYQLIASWANTDILDGIDRTKIAFLDTETSGLVGGAGTFVFLVGIGYFTNNGFQIAQFFLENPDHETAFLTAFNKALENFEVLVTYNGKSFDIPLLKNRHILNGLTSPFENMAHVDFLHIARKLWGNRYSSCRLVDLEVSVLNIARTQEEVAGWQIPEIYFDYIESGATHLLPAVFYHNAMDILSLASLFEVGEKITYLSLEEPSQVQSLDLVSVGRIYEEVGDEKNASFLYEKGLKSGLPEASHVRTITRLASLYKRKKDWERAVELWRYAATVNFLPAFLELAKYFEHQNKNLGEAKYWVEKALQILNGESGSNPLLERNFRHRLERIDKKLGKCMERKIT